MWARRTSCLLRHLHVHFVEDALRGVLVPFEQLLLHDRPSRSVLKGHECCAPVTSYSLTTTDERVSQTGAGVKHHGEDVGARSRACPCLCMVLFTKSLMMYAPCELLTVICIS